MSIIIKLFFNKKSKIIAPILAILFSIALIILFFFKIQETNNLSIESAEKLNMISVIFITIISIFMFLNPSPAKFYKFFESFIYYGYTKNRIKIYSLSLSAIHPVSILFTVIMFVGFFLFSSFTGLTFSLLNCLNSALILFFIIQIIRSFLFYIKDLNLILGAISQIVAISVYFWFFTEEVLLKGKFMFSFLLYISNIGALFSSFLLPILLFLWYLVLTDPLANGNNNISFFGNFQKKRILVFKEIYSVVRCPQAVFHLVLSYLMLIIPFLFGQVFLKKMLALTLYYFGPIIYINLIYGLNMFGYEISEIKKYNYFPYSAKVHLFNKIKINLLLNILTLVIYSIIMVIAFRTNLTNALILIVCSISISSGLFSIGLLTSKYPYSISYKLSINGKTLSVKSALIGLVGGILLSFFSYLSFFLQLTSVGQTVSLLFMLIIIHLLASFVIIYYITKKSNYQLETYLSLN